MESARQAMKYVSESVQGHASGASKGVNKEIAKDPNVRLSSRLTAAKDALGDKLDETAHKNKAQAHKQYAKA